MKPEQIYQDIAEHAQTTTQKFTTLGAGGAGISLSFMDIATAAQAIGMIVGCILVCGQAYIFFRDLFRKRNRK